MTEAYEMKTFLEDIRFPEDLQELILGWTGQGLAELRPYLDGLLSKEGAYENFLALAKALGEDPEHMRMLAAQLEAARMCRGRYDSKGIGRSVYVDTMKYFTRAITGSVKKYGRYVFDCSWWTYRQLNMSIFRLGELEFEFAEDGAGKAVNVHIPSDARLRKEYVLASVEECRAFCSRYCPEYEGAPFKCRSWLLSPRLEGILKDGSNILAFQNLFDIQDIPDDRYFYDWIFDADENTPIENLKEETSLQRGVKALLSHGNTLGGGAVTLKGITA